MSAKSPGPQKAHTPLASIVWNPYTDLSDPYPLNHPGILFRVPIQLPQQLSFKQLSYHDVAWERLAGWPEAQEVVHHNVHWGSHG